jgi:hypothetical protein
MKKTFFSFFGVPLLVVICALAQDHSATAVPSAVVPAHMPNKPLLVARFTQALTRDTDAKGSGKKPDKSSGKPKPFAPHPPPPPPPRPHKPPPPSGHKDRDDRFEAA